MKTYDERMQAILKKAKVRKAVRFTVKATVSVFVMVAVVWAAMQLPNLGGTASNMEVPVMTAPGVTTTIPQENNAPTAPPQPTDVFDPIKPDPPSPTVPNQSGLEFTTISIKTTGESPVDAYPAIHLIRSKEAMQAFCQQRDQKHIGFEAVKKQAEYYTDTYFENKSLIIVMLAESSGSNRHNVLGIGYSSDGSISIEIERTVPEMGTCDMAYWYLFIEVNWIISDERMVSYRILNGAIVDELPAEPLNQIGRWELEKMRQAFIDQFVRPSEGYTTDDVEISRVIAVFDRRYALFVDGIFGYPDWIETEIVNGYKFTYGSGQKMYLYYDGHYYRLQEACDAGLLSDEELQKLNDAYRKEYWFHYTEE